MLDWAIEIKEHHHRFLELGKGWEEVLSSYWNGIETDLDKAALVTKWVFGLKEHYEGHPCYEALLEVAKGQTELRWLEAALLRAEEKLLKYETATQQAREHTTR